MRGLLQQVCSLREPLIRRASRATFSHKGRRKKTLLPRLLAAGLAVALQAVEVHADVGGFGRSVRQRNGAVEGGARFVVAAELHQEGAAHAEEVKIVRQPLRQRLDQVGGGPWALYPWYRDRAGLRP